MCEEKLDTLLATLDKFALDAGRVTATTDETVARTVRSLVAAEGAPLSADVARLFEEEQAANLAFEDDKLTEDRESVMYLERSAKRFRSELGPVSRLAPRLLSF